MKVFRPSSDAFLHKIVSFGTAIGFRVIVTISVASTGLN